VNLGIKKGDRFRVFREVEKRRIIYEVQPSDAKRHKTSKSDKV